MSFRDFVSLSLATSSDDAGSDTFSIQKIIQKQDHVLIPLQIPQLYHCCCEHHSYLPASSMIYNMINAMSEDGVDQLML
jgi:hypothetical protein